MAWHPVSKGKDFWLGRLSPEEGLQDVNLGPLPERTDGAV
eukprot:CAMPEP_0179968514 /NCGR_PEP_ID=MMETSP0983-20121128/33927_1 /TAXON_ID=483367 /ORGANISM="non described non described, Strain CCMP 2436" /LENGTH=39 /DNA_ID= /DNA_START= /DNA_END= /DNA_ORIENTATION=